MPLFTTELNRIADGIGASTLTVRLHTAAPTDAQPTNGRVTAGGGLFVSGVAVAPGGISVAANGDINIMADIDYGTAVGAAGTVIALSAYRGAVPVFHYDTLPSRTVGSGDTYKINAGTVMVNGSTT